MQAWTTAIATHSHDVVCMVCSSQVGKTDGMLDVIGERMATEPVPIIYVGPSKDFIDRQFEPRLQEMIDSVPSLSAKLLRGRRLSKTRKLFAGIPLRLAHGGSSTALKSDPAALAFIDEYDELSVNVRKQGDPLGLVRARGHTYVEFVVGVASTPTIGPADVEEINGLEFWKVIDEEDMGALESPVWRLWQTGTRKHWAWKCAHCEEYFIPRFSCLRWKHEKNKHSTPAQARRTAFVECPRCGGIHEEKHKEALNKSGRYVAPGQKVTKSGHVVGDEPDTNTASFWVSGLCSPFQTFGQLAEDYVAAAHSGVPSEIQTSLNAKFGELFKLGFGDDAPKWQQVAEHKAEYFKGELPDGVVYVIVTVDVQKRRLVYVTRGWGARGTSWLLDWGEFHGETVHPEVWDALADYITNPICGKLPRVCLVDSGFRPGKRDSGPVNRVYEFTGRFPRLVRSTKGSSRAMSIPIKPTKFGVTRSGKAKRREIPGLMLDTDFWKSWVHERLDWPEHAIGSWHIPEDIDDEYMKQIVSESRTRLPSGKAIWVQHSRENHYLDCEAMQAAGAHLLNVSRLAPPPPPKGKEAEPTRIAFGVIPEQPKARPSKPKGISSKLA